jgi:hypothetical protein
MNKQISVLVGIALVLIGGLAMACVLATSVLGLGVWGWGPWRLWPLVVISVGLLFVVPPLLVRGRRGLGGLFIPGVPVLATGSILLFCSVFDAWGAWEWLWPVEVLGLAVGFLFAALYMRVIWLLIPAVIIGLNGLLFQFCAITGWWSVWAVLWTIEPLSVGLALLAVNFRQPSTGLLTAGVALCVLAGLGFVESFAVVVLSWIFHTGWLWRWVGPVMLILAGCLVLILGLLHRPSSPSWVAE